MWSDVRRLGFCWLCLTLVVPTAASAQGWLADRSGTEGPGIKLGKKLELHPGLGFEGGYDNNVFLEDGSPQASGILRTTAHLDVSTIGPKRASEGEGAQAAPAKVAFRGGGSASYLYYLSNRVQSNLEAGAKLDLSINPGGIFTPRIHERFRRTIRPFTDPNVPIGRTTSYGLNNNAAGLELAVKSKSQLIKGLVDYTYDNTWFQSSQFDYAANHTHRIKGGTSWRFFPTTALLWDLTVDIQKYPNQALVAQSATQLSDNIRAATKVGINGAVTKTFSLTGSVGYAVGFYDAGPDFDGVTGVAEARWSPRPSTSLSGGYNRSFVSSYLGNYVTSNQLYLRGQILLKQRVLLGLDTSASFDRSGLALTPAGGQTGSTARRKDIRVQSDLYAEYRATDWFAVTANVIYGADFTDFVFNQPASGGGLLINPAARYQKIEGWLGVRVFY